MVRRHSIELTVELEPYVAFEAEHTLAAIKGWLGADALADNLLRDLERSVDARTDPAALSRYQQQIPVAGATVEDYALRELEVGDGSRVLAGIH